MSHLIKYHHSILHTLLVIGRSRFFNVIIFWSEVLCQTRTRLFTR